MIKVKAVEDGVIVELGTIPKVLIRGLAELEIVGRAEPTQYTALLRLTRILRWARKTWGHFTVVQTPEKDHPLTLAWETRMCYRFSLKNNINKNIGKTFSAFFTSVCLDWWEEYRVNFDFQRKYSENHVSVRLLKTFLKTFTSFSLCVWLPFIVCIFIFTCNNIRIKLLRKFRTCCD